MGAGESSRVDVIKRVRVDGVGEGVGSGRSGRGGPLAMNSNQLQSLLSLFDFLLMISIAAVESHFTSIKLIVTFQAGNKSPLDCGAHVNNGAIKIPV